MGLEESHSQHLLHQTGNEIPELLSTDAKMGLLVTLVIVSFAMIAYVLYLVKEQQKKEQKNKWKACRDWICQAI